MNIVVAMTGYDEDMPHIHEAVKSLLDGLVQPSEILITFHKGVKVPATLKKKEKVHIQRSDKDYGQMTAIVGAMERYSSHSDVYILYLANNVTYPPHLIKEYAMCVEDLNKNLKEKLPNSNGSVYGLGGVLMVQDKKRNLDLEFQHLTGKKTDAYETRNMVAYVRETATVDYLEACCSMIIHRSNLKDDYIVYIDKVLDSPQPLCMDVVLSNYFAKHQILRTQICNLAINRFMMMRCGYLKHVMMDEHKKRVLYEYTVKHLRSLGCFYTYE